MVRYGNKNVWISQ